MIIHGRQSQSVLNLASRLEDVNIAIRWGGDNVPGALNGGRLLNGLEQLQAFRAKEIRCPNFSTSRDLALNGIVVLGRKLNHCQGRDIRFSNRPRQRGHRRWYNSDFFTEFVPSVREWRIHIFKGKSIARGVKEYSVAVPNGPEHSEWPVRSRRNGYRLRHNVDPPRGFRTAAKKAVEACGYDFGAVDILELADGTSCVLEVNSRPGIKDDYTIDAYVNAIRRINEGR